jgi:glucose/mannose transport system substrate-binding protein
MFAEIAFSKETQKDFNLSKGSIPARNDVDLSDFTPCQQMAQKHLDAASSQGTLVPSIAHSIAQPQAIRSAVMEVVSNFMNSDQGSQDAANQIADAVKSAM